MKNLTIAILSLAFFACGEGNNGTRTEVSAQPSARNATPQATYSVEEHYPGSKQDTLLANMVTFIYKRPTAAINRDRTDPQFRSYYVSKLDQFEYVHHHISADSTHWFYLIRPARSVGGDKRGVGGRFRTNAALEMVEFEELFNTPVMSEDELRSTGRVLFEEMVSTGNVDAFMQDRSKIEWPDDRLRYDVEKREWRYDVVAKEQGSKPS